MITLKSMAKVNLCLKVKEKLPNGYHEIESVMQSIDLFDVIKIKNNNSNNINIFSNTNAIPLSEDNLAHKAAELILNGSSEGKGVDIFIEKNIPVAAGLAGGSSNAAAVLVGINSLRGLGLSQEELCEMGLSLGADVPFCIVGGCALTLGIGEKMTPLKGLDSDYTMVVCKPQISISTDDAYSFFDENIADSDISIDGVLDSLDNDDIDSLRSFSGNDLDGFARANTDDVSLIIDRMNEAGCKMSLMTGSGPAVFGIFDSKERAENCYELLKDSFEQTFITRSIGRGVEIIE